MNADDEFVQGLAIGAVFTAFVFLVALFSFPYKFKHVCQEAVKLGHAEYYFDAEYNKRFRWKTNCVNLKSKE